ncbi:Copia protein [Durusdinium trenchii]|uniref:Copia protein n=1 Tax=Durusdinium trenchii TaxID=1381693 RepID=A0ABP0JRC0_9DINO
MGSETMSNGAASESAVWKDRDPPPAFNGDVDLYKQFERDLKLWRHDTDVPVKKHGVKVLRMLSGTAKAVCNELSVEQITSEQGVEHIVAKLKEHFQPHLEQTMPKAFEKAVYGDPRRGKESIGEFILRQETAFRELQEEGIKPADEVKGYILYRQSNLSQVQEDQITTWTQGRFEKPEVIKALRKLEKVQKDRPGARYLTAEDETLLNESMEGGSDSSGDYVYVGMVSEMPCKVVGGPSDHEPDPVQESSDHSQREDLPDASRQVHHAMDDATKRHASHSTQECTIGTRLPNPNTVSGIPDVLTGIEDSSHAIVASHELVGESTKQPHGHSSEASTNGNEVPMWRARSRHAARGSNEGDDIPPDASATGKSTDDGSTAKWSSNGGNNGVQRELDYDVSPEIPGGVPQEKMHQWLQYNAPRVCLLENSSQRNLWAKLQLEDEDVAEHEKRVLQGYWSESEDHKSWHYYSGILSETANDLKAIGLFANGTWEEDHYEPGQDRALSKASKKAVVKNMKALTVAEVFSPPRVAAMAEELGHRSGGSYDLQTGYDLSSSVDRMKCMKELRQECNEFGHGLAVKGLPNKKPTDFMVNGKHLAGALSKRCQGHHEHQALIGGIAKFAQKYPKGLCRAMIQGAIKEVEGQCTYAMEQEDAPPGDEVEQALDDHYERLEADKSRRQERLRRSEEEKAHEEEEEEETGSQQISKEEKRLVQKLHNNLGHPQTMDFCRALRMARARSAVWKYVKDEFRCEACEQHPRPRSARPAMLPKNFEPARTIGIDVVYFPGLDVRSVKPVLNMVDWATGYQMLEPLQSMQSEHVWNTFHSTWVRVFGMPECIVVDQGREFGKDFTEKINEMGAVMKVIGARAPWQQGRTERHGGLAKEIFVKLREDALPTSEDEWKQCIHVLEAAKNRMFNRSGFSPAQRQLGHNIRLPGSLGSDDPCDPALMLGAAGGGIQRLLEMRHLAMQAFIKHTTNVALQKATHARGRVTQHFQPGDIVYVYRAPLQRRRAKHDDSLEDKEGRRATWVGPGTIVMTEGANAWLSIRGELWKCAKEQLRKATSEEAEAKDLLQGEFEELQRSMVRKESKRGFKDVTSWPHPPWLEEDEEPPRQVRRIEEPAPPPQEDGDVIASPSSIS